MSSLLHQIIKIRIWVLSRPEVMFYEASDEIDYTDYLCFPFVKGEAYITYDRKYARAVGTNFGFRILKEKMYFNAEITIQMCFKYVG